MTHSPVASIPLSTAIVKLAQVNLNGLCSKLHSLQSFIISHNLKVITVTESHLLSHIPDSFVDIPPFKLLRSDSSGSVHKHGVCAYIHSSLLVDHVSCHKPNTLSFRLAAYNVYILVIYRPPSSTPSENHELAEFIASFCLGKEVILMGDFNLPNINWCGNAGETSSCPPLEKQFLDVFDLLGLKQWVREPTFPRSSNILDLILTSDTDRVGQISVPPPLPGCDHCPTLLDYVFSYSDIPDEPSDGATYRRAWHKGNFRAIRDRLSDMNWHSLSGMSANDGFDHLASTLNLLTVTHVPMASPPRNKPPWPTRPPTSLIHERQRAWSNYKSTRGRLGRSSDTTRLAYRSFSEVNKCCRNFAVRSQATYEESLIKRFRENPKVLHAYIRKKKVGRPTVGPLTLASGELSDDAKQMSECLADAFASVYASTTPSSPASHQEFDGSLDQLSLGKDQVRASLTQIDQNSSMGPDGIHPMILKECATELAEPLTMIFNKSLQEGSVPSLWKSSLVTPIFKKGIRYDPLNYRPISINSVCGKELERFLYTHLCDYLESNSLLSDRQFGFRSGRSTIDQLLLVYNAVSKVVDEGGVADVILFDFSKAFDVVSHVILLEKLNRLGLHSSLLQWFESFLTGRQMRVCVRGETSNLRDVKSGVPQGSILGPLLFLVYINNIASHLRSSYVIFADDLKLYACVSRQTLGTMPSAIPGIQSDIDLLISTALSWGLRMNVKKCAVLRFSRHSRDLAPPTYYLDGQAIPVVEKHKDLGVLVDNQLKFHDHIREVAQKAGGLAHSFLKSTVSRSPEFMLFLWTTHVRPVIEYGSCLWNTGYLTDLSLLEKIQRRWTKQISGLDNLCYSERLRSLNLYSVQGRLLRADLIQYWKILNNKSCIRHDQLFTTSNFTRTRGHSLKLFHPHVTTDIRKRAFSVRCIQLWNRLPQETVSAVNLASFKQQLSTHIHDELFAFAGD